MNYSPIFYTGDGSTTDYSVPFPYLSGDDVSVTVNGEEAEFSFLSENIVQLSSAPANGAKIRIERETGDDNPIVVWNNAVALTAKQLNDVIKQVFYLSQESKAATRDTIHKNYAGVFTAQDKKIVDVGYPSAYDDAATKQYVDDRFAEDIDTVESLLADTETARDAAQASATSAAGSATSAADSASAAAASAAAAATSKTNAASSATAAAASKAAAATSEANAAASATAAAASKTAAAASEANAAASATAAAASKTAAAASEANSAVSATAAAASKNAAATSATSAADSASAAAASAAAAATFDPSSYSTTAEITTILSNYAPLASPNLSGNPTATTQSAKNNSTRLATTAFVQTDKGYRRAIRTLTASTTLTSTHLGNLVVCNATAATTMTLPSASSYTQGILSLVNINTGLVTMSGSIIYDGATVTSRTLPTGASVDLVSNGTSWVVTQQTLPDKVAAEWTTGTDSVPAPISPAQLSEAIAAAVVALAGGALPKGVVEIYATGAYKPTAGTKYILAILRGGGGGGGGAAAGAAGGGAGGEGALGLALIPVDPAVTYAVTVGYGGLGNTAGNNGYDGGATSIVAGGITYLAGGGQGGQASGLGGVGGTPGNTCILGFMGAAGVSRWYAAAPVWRQSGAAYGIGGGPSQAPGESGSSTGGNGYIGHVTILEFGS